MNISTEAENFTDHNGERYLGALKKENGKLSDALKSLLLNRLPPEKRQKITKKDLNLYLTYALEGLHERAEARARIRLHEADLEGFESGRYILTISNEDSPFIVDSLLQLLLAYGLKVEFIIHPVLVVNRDEKGAVQSLGKTSLKSGKKAESFIFAQLKKQKPLDEEAFVKDIHELFIKLAWTVTDLPHINTKLQEIQNHLGALAESSYSAEDVGETKELISWLNERHFIFLGARYMEIESHLTPKGCEIFCLKPQDKIRELGLFKDEKLANADDMVPAFARAKIQQSTPLQPNTFPLVTVTKTNQRSPIHRASRIDSIEIIDCNQKGVVTGVYQFIGIFTKDSFYVPAFDVPLLKQKAVSVFKQFGLDPTWHDGKAVIAILDSIPRDEMFYLSQNELGDITQKVLNMRDTGRLTVFMRPDSYGFYLTVMVFMPRDRYSHQLKDSFAEILKNRLNGIVTSSVAHVGDLPFARIIYVLTYDTPQKLAVDKRKIEDELHLVSLSWAEQLEGVLAKKYSEEKANRLAETYGQAFESKYCEAFTPSYALKDIEYLEHLTPDQPVDMQVYICEKEQAIKVKIFHYETPLSLSTLLPVLYNLGIRVTAETTYAVRLKETRAYIHDFDLEWPLTPKWDQYIDALVESFKAIQKGDIENDGLNQLTLKAGLSSRQICVIRAYSHFLQQTKLPFSLQYVENTLIYYPDILIGLSQLFETRFNPDLTDRNSESIIADIEEKLQFVSRLDHDRILRRFLNGILSTIRTNYYQKDKKTNQFKDYISFKFDCACLNNLPQPRPLFEVYVYSSRLEAVHLRSGKVSRGGIRWSDRFEDFRSEVLGLMKAQKVKNSVIVPLGSKGGFIVKRQEQFSNRADLMPEVIHCYQTMMRGLLDITDNLVDGQVIAPPRVVRYDEDDPYLVVAADKGTATFSDIANDISKEYGFWLDDAFASGGSAGYDHKKMAITSRGAWESVKRHFREMGIDTQKTPFTVLGVGDMAGDVFGNGMLRSDKISLIAAFNHQHIFIDPTPDPQKSFEERRRLFSLPRSSWADYDRAILSSGGAVFERSQKTISLTPQIKTIFGLTADHMAPDDLILHLLKSPVDLIWFGGIGTFVKSASESHLDVGDNANTAIRIDADQLKARVIGEGANLGMTQLGRIDYALKGGRLNTDAIDNSAGVDCSDHEVNIKILFNLMKDKVSRVQRDDLLITMTNDVARLVLKDNYQQTQILSLLEAGGAGALLSYQSLIKKLENDISLNRALEFLPEDEAIERRLSRGVGLTRPELAILLAYAKLDLYNKLIKSPLVEDIYFHPTLRDYFPKVLSEKFEWAVNRHPLRKEIIATTLCNSLINKVGITFVPELAQASGRSEAEVVKCFFQAVDLFGLETLWGRLDDLDGQMLCSFQTDAYKNIAIILRESVLWLLRHRGGAVLQKAHIHRIQEHLGVLVEGDQQQVMARQIITFCEMGVPQTVAEDLTVISHYPAALDIASHAKKPEETLVVAKAYFLLRSNFGLDWLSCQIHHLTVESDWQRAAQLSLLDDLNVLQSALVDQLITAGHLWHVSEWLDAKKNMIERANTIIDMVQKQARPDSALLSFAVGQLQRVVGVK